ncbi:MAG: class I SAM-dependent RNA methyltransferase [Alphaproteobacteria bacterium]|nr:class I SAM-dependent RNA methyltransferase [Alphaproteobacteria bacterium]
MARPSQSRAPQSRTKFPANTPPVTLAIEHLGGRGDGVATHQGERYFVPLALPGDVVSLRPVEATAEGIRGEIVELVTASPDRQDAPCEHFGRCGGCLLQHVAPAAYADFKRAQVLVAVERAGGDPAIVAELATIPPRSRRRATLVARRVSAGLALGFHEHRGHFIVDVQDCPILHPALMAVFPALRETLALLLEMGESATIALLKLDSGIDALIDLERQPDLAGREALAALAETADLCRLSIRIGGINATPELAAERRPASQSFGGIAVPVPPGAFLQATDAAEAILVGAVTQAVAGAKRIADLYAGCGTFALPMAAAGASVLAAEGFAPALDALTTAARRASPGLALETSLRDLARDPLQADDLADFDAVVFDPPRAGAREQTTQIAASEVPVVVAVSCNPSTFSRDAKILIEGGYTLERVLPVDQFLWSAHVELVAVFRR